MLQDSMLKVEASVARRTLVPLSRLRALSPPLVYYIPLTYYLENQQPSTL